MDLEGIMLSEIRQRKTNMISLWNQKKQRTKAKLRDTENRVEMGSGRGWEENKVREGGEKHKLPIVKPVTHEAVIHSMLTTVNNTILHM